MTVVLRPTGPARLAGVFLGSVAAFGLIAAACYAVLYIVDNETSPKAVSAPAANLDLPAGFVAIRPVEVDMWVDELEFDPVLAERLPANVVKTPLYFLQQPSEGFSEAGHVRYAYEDGTPAISLIEQRGMLESEVPMKVLESAGKRAYVINVACGDLVIQAQMYFSIDGPTPTDAATMTAIADTFGQDLRDQCGD